MRKVNTLGIAFVLVVLGIIVIFIPMYGMNYHKTQARLRAEKLVSHLNSGDIEVEKIGGWWYQCHHLHIELKGDDLHVPTSNLEGLPEVLRPKWVEPGYYQPGQGYWEFAPGKKINNIFLLSVPRGTGREDGDWLGFEFVE